MATVSMRGAAGAAFVLAALARAGAARADDMLKPSHDGGASGPKPRAPAEPSQPGVAESAPIAPVTPSRRGGFTFGLDAGLGVASVGGYPNDVKKTGDPRYYTTTGARPTALLEAWAGGAFTEWFTFTLGATTGFLFDTGANTARSLGGMFHVEAFPLFALGGHLRDLGVRIDAGLGTAMVLDTAGTKLVDGSLASIFGGGFFYEGIRAWKTAHGPFLMASYLWSGTAQRPAIFLGWRSVLYTKP